MLWSIGSQRVGHDLVIEWQQQCESLYWEDVCTTGGEFGDDSAISTLKSKHILKTKQDYVK